MLHFYILTDAENVLKFFLENALPIFFWMFSAQSDDLKG